jgi:hypothetical protein
VRFICEWCYEQVSIVERQSPYNEVLAHFRACPRRSPLTTDEQVTGLAGHITKMIADREDRQMQQTG